MKNRFWILAAAGLVLFSGCAKESEPAEDGDAWEVPATSTETEVESADAKAPTEPAAPADPTLLVTLKGSDFKMENTTAPVQSEVLRIGHYFSAGADFELKTSATVVESHLEGKTVDGASPLIGLRITTTSGKYQDFDLGTRPIDGEQHLKDAVEIGPGQYKATISYFKDTGDGKRPHILVKKIEFRNPENK